MRLNCLGNPFTSVAKPVEKPKPGNLRFTSQNVPIIKAAAINPPYAPKSFTSLGQQNITVKVTAKEPNILVMIPALYMPGISLQKLQKTVQR